MALTFHLTPVVYVFKLTKRRFYGFFCPHTLPPIVHDEVRTLHRY